MKLINEILSLFEQISFSTTGTGLSDVDDILADPDYHRENKKRFAEIIYMNPDDYIDLATSYMVKGDSRFSQEDIINSRLKNIDNMEILSKAENVPMPLLGFHVKGSFQQEGLHRALVAKNQGLDSIPVVVTWSSDTIKDYEFVLNKVKGN